MLGHSLRAFTRTIKQWFKPTFSFHPLNFIFVILLGFGSFAWSSIAFAWEDDGSWSDGRWWSTSGGAGPTAGAACADAGLTWNDRFPPYAACLRPDMRSGGSPVQQYCQHIDESDSVWAKSGCGTSPGPENNCPDYGSVKKVSKLINGKVIDGQFIPRDKNATPTITIGGGSSVDGCGYAVPIGENIPSGYTDKQLKADIDCSHQGEGDDRVLMCFKHQIMIATGEPLEPAEGEVNSFVPTDDIDYSEGGSKSLIEDTEDHTQTPETVVTNPDGSSVTTSTTVDTLVKDKGARVIDSSSTSVITESDGIQKTVTTTLTEVVFPDGSKEVVTDKKTAYTQTPQTVFNIDNSTGNVSITHSDGSSASTSEKTTDTYDSEGNKTGSKTETGKEGEGEAEEEQEKDQCEAKPNSEECQEEELPEGIDYGEVESWWEPAYPDGLSGVLSEARERIEDNGLVSGFLSPSGFPSSGQLPSFYVPGLSLGPFSWGGGTISFLDIVVSFLRTVIMIFALLEARRLVFGG